MKGPRKLLGPKREEVIGRRKILVHARNQFLGHTVYGQVAIPIHDWLTVYLRVQIITQMAPISMATI
jgi:hypothetical protein